jgi:hypothetical protein
MQYGLLAVKPDPEHLRTVFNRLERMIEDRWDRREAVVPVVLA